MKRTEKDIYDFVKEKLDHIDKIIKHKVPNETGLSVLELIATREAYHEVLNFIGTVRVGEEKKIVGTTTVDKAFEKFLLDTCPEVKKKLEVLKIIASKEVDIYYLKKSRNLKKYNDNWNIEGRDLTQAQFDLLKEVFK
jgi:hypothetical protein